MKVKKVFLFCSAASLALIILLLIVRHPRTQAATTPAAAAKRSVVVELFTSEGCSSCPPADELLGQLRQEPNANGAEVIPLGFHVDYWDFQGWRDRFDSPAFSQRQQDYAGHLHTEGPYTPQMIVDGAVEFVGSSAGRAKQAIEEAGSQPAAAQIEISASPKRDLAVKTTSATSADVMLAITEDNLETKVGAGENGGRTLHHSAVVRDFRRIGQNKGGVLFANVPLTIANDWKRSDLRVVVFAQDAVSGRILGAASRPLNSLIPAN
jgi:hypothetical protein